MLRRDLHGGYANVWHRNPWNAAVDRNNNVWFCGAGNNALIELSVSTVSNAPVITLMTLPQEPSETNLKTTTYRRVAIDSSGNAWLSNNPNAGGAYLTVVVGMAAPVVTPLTVALNNDRIGQRP